MTPILEVFVAKRREFIEQVLQSPEAEKFGFQVKYEIITETRPKRKTAIEFSAEADAALPPFTIQWEGDPYRTTYTKIEEEN